ncbi:hypothetical protein Cgig2_015456 [Carnegiea gigantea]|uniref:Uncharacterized protein n=1 Tax=Carnegiea gigantea TaxID=171969 RepID=A0A9Q1JY21_9CARY|nr:hypothetical protein Cgig2_015456 [Carnegiea gigantea]
MGNNINKNYMLNCPQQLHQKDNNAHIVPTTKRNCKPLDLSMTSQQSLGSREYKDSNIAHLKGSDDLAIDNTTQSFSRSFSLGISPEKGQCASCSLDISPTTLKFSFSPKGAGTASTARIYYQHINREAEMDGSLGKSQESLTHIHKPEKEKAVPRNAKGVHGITKPPMRNDELDN